MTDLAVDLATLAFVAVIVLLTWAVARSMRSQLTSRPPGAPVLVVSSAGRLQGLEVRVDRPLIIGRGQAADLHVIDDTASDAHCRLEPSGDRIAIVDLDSTNGTFLNEKPIDGRAIAGRGDTVRIGRTIMEVR